ncbi:MAG: EAL domain-containing protein [Gammaproteobacteria bacterium]|nr:EAL domain-containing protein [Gammaproteobacteria bacterium]
MIRLKLRSSIVLAVIGGLLIPAVVGIWLTLSQQEAALIRQLSSDHERLAESLALGMREPLWNFDADTGNSLIESALEDERVIGVVVRDEKENVFLLQQHPERRLGHQLKIDRDIFRDNKVVGHVSVEIDTGQLDAAIVSNRQIFLATVLGQLLLSLFLILVVFQVRLLAPIRRLMQESGRLARRELMEPFVWYRNDELGMLGDSLERTRQSLQTLFNELETNNRALESLTAEQQSIFENAGVGIAFLKQRRIVRCNQTFAAMFGYRTEQLVGASTQMLYQSEVQYEVIGAEVYAAVERGGSHVVDEELRRRDRTFFWTTSTLTAVDCADMSKGVIWAVQDVDQRKRAESALREREARIHRLIESNIIGVFFFDLGGLISDANDAFLQLLRYSRDDLLAQKIHWSALTPPEYRAADEFGIQETLRTGSCTPYEKEYICEDGTRVPVLMGMALLEGSRKQAVAFVLDLTERKHAEERIRYLAQHDALTGLPNRLLFRDRVSQAIVQARRAGRAVAVMFVDLDRFKDINDSLGHPVGDRLLRITARRLQRCLRQGDSVARLGGDEFVISLPDLVNDDDVVLIAGKILESLRRPFLVDKQELHVTGSIGISLYPNDGEDVEALMRAADTAMYHAKEHGRNNYQFFTPRLNEAAQRRLIIANRLYHALDRHELFLHFQPQVDLRSGRIFAAEALLRWRQPDDEVISTSEFVKIAEESGLILAIGAWVLREACLQLKRWHDAGFPDLCISVNLSPHQFRHADLSDLTARILDETGVPPSSLNLEITEGVLMMQSPENIATLQQLAAMGVRLSVDDFGTGYSSLSYLQRFPIHALKIDQSFVDGIGQDSNDTAIVTTVIAMADSLRLNVVAEGVQTVEQAVFLRSHGCSAAQGFYFSQAVSADDFSELLRLTDTSDLWTLIRGPAGRPLVAGQ